MRTCNVSRDSRHCPSKRRIRGRWHCIRIYQTSHIISSLFSDSDDKDLGDKFTFEDMFSDEFAPISFTATWIAGMMSSSIPETHVRHTRTSHWLLSRLTMRVIFTWPCRWEQIHLPITPGRGHDVWRQRFQSSTADGQQYFCKKYLITFVRNIWRVCLRSAPCANLKKYWNYDENLFQ